MFTQYHIVEKPQTQHNRSTPQHITQQTADFQRHEVPTEKEKQYVLV
jgi:hypothetical protein